MGTKFDRYRVREGDKVDLCEIDADDNSAFDGGKEAATAKLDEVRDDIAVLQERLYAEDKHKVLVVLQAMDTAGKDSTIRDVFKETSPNGVHTFAFGRPSTEELAHDYLWRTHQHTPGSGQIHIFNRSHYEDVLVVRVNELVPEKTWKRRYEHISNFEQMLADEGTTILKFFLNISRDEQRERLQERVDLREKNWKFDPGDLPVRARWNDYMSAYEDAIEKTSTEQAPWFVIPANRRWYRKLAVAEIVSEALRDLDPRFPPPAAGIEGLVIE
ncbi:MAG: polyphosphate kinase 2 family protein [Actinomycetia bacterium]|nr:polyphosphate kinase 2 family protein [Actinomycetes bacterium]MCP4959366.1 polyphosphate kinase 2 family protein [Actinomycetes bacterium]